MEKSFEKYKGIHPGKVLSRILEPAGTKKAEFARSIGTYPQTLNEILKGKRKLPIELTLRIDNALGYPEGTFAELQTYFEIKKAKKKMSEYHPDFNKIRPAVFWDTDIESIDFKTQKKGVIERILERGNELEREVIYNFYGEEIIKNYFIHYLNIFENIEKSNFVNNSENQFDWHNFLIQLKDGKTFSGQILKEEGTYVVTKDRGLMNNDDAINILPKKKNDIKKTFDINDIDGENLKFLFKYWDKNFRFQDDQVENDIL